MSDEAGTEADPADSAAEERPDAGTTEDPTDGRGTPVDDASADGGGQDGRGEDRSAPLDGLAERVAKRRQRDDDEFDAMFSEESVGEVDRETLWQQVTDDSEVGGAAEAPRRELRVVRKASYCQQCRYFTEPPAVACTHEGTEILEVADNDHFLVANCPIVREDEELGDISNVMQVEEYDGILDALGDRND